MTYDSSVLALSPWGYWKTDEASGNLADSSGNSRTMTVTGSPTYAQTGPSGAADAVSWTNVASQHAETSATTAAGAFTYVAWVYLTATPAANLAIMSRAVAYGTAGAADGRLFIDTAGKVNFSVFAGATFTVTAPSALPLNTWVMVSASVGAGGMRLRQNKVSQGTNAANTAYTGANQLIFIRGGDTGYTSTAPITIAKAAYFASQLSTADTDGLYDAMVAGPSGTASLSLTASGGATAPGSGSAALTLSASGAAVAPAAGSAALTLSATGVTGASSSASGSATLDLAASGAGAGAGSGSAALSLSASGSAVLGAAGTAHIELGIAGEAAPLYETDTSNAFDGLDFTFTGTATVERAPAVAPPSLVLATKVDKAVPYPVPVMVNGRPT